MKIDDMFGICRDNFKFLDDKKVEFLISLTKQKAKNRGALPALSPQQHAYLQACYDQAVSRKYGVEPMATDGEWAARRAISKARSGRGK